jgi:3-oxoacyl-[acyl-carrier protein] reductase
MTKRLSGKVAIITGASKGIGKSIARAYAREGASLVLTARTQSTLDLTTDELKRDFGCRVLSVPGNVANVDDVRRAVDAAVKELGSIDVLVNNAGVPGVLKDLEEITEVEWDEVMNVNVKGAFLFSREVLPQMRKQHSGNIINMSSGAGEKKPMNVPIRSINYNVSKFALEGLNYSLAGKLLGTGINVNAMKPGAILTDIHATTPPEVLKEMEKRIGFDKPEVVNPLAIYLATLRPGELTGASIRASDWNREHQETSL